MAVAAEAMHAKVSASLSSAHLSDPCAVPLAPFTMLEICVSKLRVSFCSKTLCTALSYMLDEAAFITSF